MTSEENYSFLASITENQNFNFSSEVRLVNLTTGKSKISQESFRTLEAATAYIHFTRQKFKPFEFEIFYMPDWTSLDDWKKWVSRWMKD